MTLSDNRFGAEIITQKGKLYKFDDAHCAISFLHSGTIDQASVDQIYFTDFSDGHTLITSKNALFLRSESLTGPMGGNITVFGNSDSLNFVMKDHKGSVLHWDELNKQ
jgi:copper chaperone NosL